MGGKKLSQLLGQRREIHLTQGSKVVPDLSGKLST